MYLTYIYASPAHAEPTHRCASNAPNSPAHTRIFVSHKTKASSAPLSPLTSAVTKRLLPGNRTATDALIHDWLRLFNLYSLHTDTRANDTTSNKQTTAQTR